MPAYRSSGTVAMLFTSVDSFAIVLPSPNTSNRLGRMGGVMKIKELAALLGATEAEAAGFVACLRVFTDKGHSVERAIELSSAAWHTLLANMSDAVNNELSRHKAAGDALTAQAVGWFYPSLAGAAP